MTKKQVIRALTGSARLEIIKLLGKKSMRPIEIANALDITADRVCHQLWILLDAKAVTRQRRGKEVFYTLKATTACYGGVSVEIGGPKPCPNCHLPANSCKCERI